MMMLDGANLRGDAGEVGIADMPTAAATAQKSEGKQVGAVVLPFVAIEEAGEVR